MMVDSEAQAVTQNVNRDLLRKKVLVADDNIEFLSILATVLGDQGYEVTMARNGSQAYEKILHHEYDLVILDVKMPKMGGVEAVKAIRERNPHVYIIMFSGEATQSEIADALVYGADRFLTKPLGIKRLIEEIKQIDSLRHDTR